MSPNQTKALSSLNLQHLTQAAYEEPISAFKIFKRCPMKTQSPARSAAEISNPRNSMNYKLGGSMNWLTPKITFLSAALLLMNTRANAADILYSSATSSTFLTAGNWTGGVAPGATDNAQIGVNPTPGTQVNINAATSANKTVGAIEMANGRLITLNQTHESS